MMNETINKAVFCNYIVSKENADKDQIGYFMFNLLQNNSDGSIGATLHYLAKVYRRDNRVIINYDCGNPPSARAGNALDLHHAAAAVVRKDAAKIKADTAFFINDAGKLAAMPLADFYAKRAPEVIATAPALFAHDDYRLYAAVAGSAPLCGAVIPAPSPPAP